MSVDMISEDANIISRLQLAKALKEDFGNGFAEPPENSAIFLRQRNRTTKYGVQPSRGSFYIPRPTNLLVPPVLGNAEDNNFAAPSTQPNILSSQQQILQQDRRPSLPQINTPSPRNSIIMPEEKRGSTHKPATLMDVRESILEVRHNLQNSIPFSSSSSQRTSIILQQNKSLSDANGKPHGASKLSNVTNSRSVPSPRPISAYTNNSNSRPTSFYKSSKSSNDDEDDEEPKSKKSKEIKKSGPLASDDSNSAPKLPPIKSVTNQTIVLEKVKEEDNSSDESDDDDDDGSDDESSEDDTPLALKPTPKIKVAPPKITTRKSSGGRIEAWLEHVSGSPEGSPSRSSTPTHSPRPSTPTHSPRPSTPTHSPRSSTPTHSPRSSTPTHSPRPSTPTHSPTHAHSPRVRKTSEHSIHQYNSSPLSPHRMSYMAEPVYDARNHRPKSAYIPDNLQAPKPDFNQPRKRSNSEFVPKIRTNSMYEQVPPFPIGRVSPSPRQDSGYWAKDTLIALSDDLRHMNIMNDSNSSHSSNSRSRSASIGNINSNNAKLSPANNISKVINRHRRDGSGSSVHSTKANIPQLHIQGNYLPQAHSSPQIPVIQTSRSKDSLSVYLPSPMNGNRNSLYMSNNNIQKKISSEQLKANRISTYSQKKSY